MLNTIIFTIALAFSFASFYNMVIKMVNVALQGGKKNISLLLPIITVICWVIFYHYSK